MASRHSVQMGIREVLLSRLLLTLQSRGKRTEKMRRRMASRGARRTARCLARCSRRFRSSVSRLLKTTLQPALYAPMEDPDLSPAPRVAREALVGACPVPKHRDQIVYVLRCAGAMPRRVPEADFTEI